MAWRASQRRLCRPCSATGADTAGERTGLSIQGGTQFGQGTGASSRTSADRRTSSAVVGPIGRLRSLLSLPGAVALVTKVAFPLREFGFPADVCVPI